MKNPWIIPVATLVVGAAGGYLSGKNSGPDGKPVPQEESSQRTRSGSRGADGASASSGTKKNSRTTSFEDISKIPGNSARIQALLEYYAGLTPEQLAEEATKLENLPMNERMMASFLLFGQWAEKDPTAAMTFSNSMGFAGGMVRPTILQSWASKDPENAAKYYLANPREFDMMGMGMGGGRGGQGGQSGASIIAGEWARQDPKAAMAWAAGLTTDKGQAMTSVVTEIAKSDPRAAAAMIGQMDAGDRANAYRSVASQYGALDFSEAQTWIRSLPADDQAAALASAIGGLSNTNPTEAAKQVALMEPGDARNRVMGDVVQDLARVDPQSAADFLKQQSGDDGALRQGMRDLIPTWSNQDPKAALAYANSFDGQVRDSALQAYVFSNNTTPPSDLIKVASTIEDDGDRDRAIGMTAARWMREDKEAASAYIEASSDLSDEAKERLTSGGGMFGGGRGGQGGGGGGAPGGGQRGGGNRGGGGGGR